MKQGLSLILVHVYSAIITLKPQSGGVSVL